MVIQLRIEIDSKTKWVDYVSLEGRKIKSHEFDFKNGKWIYEAENFPLSADNDLDIIIVVVGYIKGTTSSMEVFFDKTSKGKFNTYKPFNKNGYALFDEEVS